MDEHGDSAARAAGARALTLLPFLIAVAVAAGAGGWAASSARSTYAALELPFFAPPGWLFGPVWSVLYVLVAVAGWLLWRRAGWGVALWWWSGQLLLNAAWSPLFFGADRYTAALVLIVVLDLAVIALTVMAASVSRPAMWLLLPYLAWILFATALNTGIVVLN